MRRTIALAVALACITLTAPTIAAEQPTPMPGPPKIPDNVKMKSTASGLQYVDLVEGKGLTPNTGDLCIVHYTAWLESGKELDTSTRPRPRDPRDPSKGEKVLPFGFKVGTGQVIAGWDEGVSTMKEGGTRLLFIPPQLAYGAKGMGNAVPPDSRITFKVELLKIRHEPTPAAPGAGAAPPAPANP